MHKKARKHAFGLFLFIKIRFMVPYPGILHDKMQTETKNGGEFDANKLNINSIQTDSPWNCL